MARSAELAYRLSGRRDPSFVGTLVAAYAEAGRFSDAVKTIQEARRWPKRPGPTIR